MLCASILTVLISLPDAAECVTKADLTKGISFTRLDGHAGRIQTQGGTLTRRSIHFRDLGLRLKTVRDAVRNGLTTLVDGQVPGMGFGLSAAGKSLTGFALS